MENGEEDLLETKSTLLRHRKVQVHIYDVPMVPCIKQVNDFLHVVGTGAFHAAVEISQMDWDGQQFEWSYGYCEGGSGVFVSDPKSNECFIYRESIDMGTTSMSQPDFEGMIVELEEADRWQGDEYDLLSHNCCHFVQELCRKLGVREELPRWVMSLAAFGSGLANGISDFADFIQNAKDGKIPVPTGSHLAKGFVEKAKSVDKKVHLSENVRISVVRVNKRFKISKQLKKLKGTRLSCLAECCLGVLRWAKPAKSSKILRLASGHLTRTQSVIIPGEDLLLPKWSKKPQLKPGLLIPHSTAPA